MSKMKVLISDKLSKQGINVLSDDFVVDINTGLSETQLVEIIGNYDALIVRSQTKVTEKIIKAASKLKIIGRAGVGVDNIDVMAATKKGIIVVNSPEGNTIAAAELAFALLLSMARNIPFAHASLQKGEWKRSDFKGIELYGKYLGVIGLGKIGSRVVKYAKTMGMDVFGYDPYVNYEYAKKIGVTLTPLDEIIENADFLSFHIPKNEETYHLVDKDKFNIMKDGVMIVNAARGGIIVEKDLKDAVASGKIRAASVDVFENEPIAEGHVLLQQDRIITTPHIGAVTEEAQENVAIDVAEQINIVLAGGQARSAVNIPSLKQEILDPVKDFIGLSVKLGTFAAQLAHREAINKIEIEYKGELASKNVAPLKLAVLKGILFSVVREEVNFVNAEIIAKDRDISTVEIKYEDVSDYKNLISVNINTGKNIYMVSGTTFEDIGDMIVAINSQKINVKPEGRFLIVPNDDQPGIIGKIGTVLGDNKVNIANMLVGRESKGGNAIMIVSVDQNVDKDIIAQLESFAGIRGTIKQVSL